MEGIKAFNQTNRLEINTRFDPRELLEDSLTWDKPLIRHFFLKSFDLPTLGDDWRWHFGMKFLTVDRLNFRITDNGDTSGPGTEKFDSFNHMMFGSIIDRFAVQKLPKQL